MWSIILVASVIAFLIRVSPSLFHNIRKISQMTRVNKFLDYTICMITGEIIYSIAFEEIPSTEYMTMTVSTLTLLVSSLVMWRTGSLATSFTSGIGFFIMLYSVLL